MIQNKNHAKRFQLLFIFNKLKFYVNGFFLKLASLLMILTLSSNIAWSQLVKLETEHSSNAEEKAKTTLKESAGRIWFQENKGQLPSFVQYAFKTNFGAVYVEDNAIVLATRKRHEVDDELKTNSRDSNYTESHIIRLTFEGGNQKLQVKPLNRMMRNINYFTSPTPEGFVYDVSAYAELYIEDVYPGVDLRLYSIGKGQMEFDWILDRAEDYKKIKMRAEGQDGIDLHKDGGFAFKCRMQNLDFKLPESYQYIDGEKKLVQMRYTMNNNMLFFEETTDLQADKPLVIDPTVLWATYMDETSNDYLFATEIDNCGRMYMAGRSNDNSINTTYVQGATGYDQTWNGNDYNTIMYIFSADGDSIKAFTYFGQNTTPADMELFPNGRVLVAGSMRDKNGVNAGNIPATTNGSIGGKPTYASFSTSATLAGRGWLAIFDSEFSHLHYSTHMPGTNGTFSKAGLPIDEKGVTSLSVVDDNTYYAAGLTDVAVHSGAGTTFVDASSSPDITFSRGEAYIVRFSGTSYNTRDWGTYVGGDADELFMSIKLSSDETKLTFAGNFDVGTTSGAGFPSRVNPVDNTSAGDEGFAGWLTNQNTNPGSFGMLTFLGGANQEGDLIVESMNQYLYIMGYTNSPSIPGTSVAGFTPFQAAIKGAAGTYDDFVSRIPMNGSLAPTGEFRTTYFGGGGTELSGGLIFNVNDSNLHLFITTGSASVAQVGAATGYPSVNTVPPSNFYDRDHDNAAHSNWDPYTSVGIDDDADVSFVILSPDLTQNIYTSYCGGSERDYLGNTGRLNGTGHYTYNRVSNIYALGTTVHSNDFSARGSNIFSDKSYDTTVAAGDDHFIAKFSLSNTDMGDAPATYDHNDPARHGTSSLGRNVAKFGVAVTDYDSKPESSIQANGDDNRNTGPALCQALLDDEDGLISVPTITVESTGTIQLPIYLSNSLGRTLNPVSFTFAGTTITATINNHGLTVGQRINITGATGVSAVLNGTWTVASVPANNRFTFVINTTPTAALNNQSVTTNPADVYAWIDFNGDGVFDASESAQAMIIPSRAHVSGVTYAFAGTTITATSNGHGLQVGEYIGIEGGEGNANVLNGIWPITARTANTFTFTINSTPAGAITGARVVQTVTRTNLVFDLATGKACPNQIKGGRTYLRMRITDNVLTDNGATAALDERSRGIANSGEIEDHVVYIRGRDYGDLPSSYGTASVMVFNDANVDYIPEDTGAVWLGATVDIETDCAQNYSTKADGDDLENDDENGVTFPSGLIKAGGTYNFGLSFTKSTSALPFNTHYGMWFDWNADGDFTDASDGFYSGSSSSLGATVNVTTPTAANFNPNFAVRTIVGRQAFIASNYNLVFINGEIEDYVNNPGILISGNLFDDGDGTYDGAVDAAPIAPINRPSGTQIWAYLIAPGGLTVIDSIAVSSNCTFYLQGANPSTTGYEVRLSTSSVAIGSAPPAVALPSNWVSVGETNGVNNSAGTGIEALTPASNSRVSVNTGILPITALDFGINLRPVSFDTTAATQFNLGGTETYPIPGLRGYDLEQGTFFGGQDRTIVIESLPPTTGAGSADLYYDSDGPGGNPPAKVVVGQVINNYEASKLLVDPLFIGSGTVTFTYAWRDSAQFKDLTPATVRLPFTSINISGTVYQDADGVTDSDVDGTAKGVFSGTQLYAYLINASNNIIDVKTVNSNGTYSFNSANNNSSYKVLITSQELLIGNTAPGSSTLPANFYHVGEDYGSNNNFASGIVTSGWNGFIDVTTDTSDITGVDFGIEYGTYAHDKTYTIDPINIDKTFTGNYNYQMSLPLYDASGTNDTTYNGTAMPGKVSGFDLEEGRFDGSIGVSGSATFVVNSLPPTGNGQLQYDSIDLIPSPSNTDPSWIYWNSLLNRYEIPNFDASNLNILLAYAYQNNTIFTYSYIDAAGISGRVATYTINYTVPLPIDLFKFNAVCHNTHVSLYWSTSTEENSSHFEIQSSTDGENWENTGTVYTKGYSSQLLNYEYHVKINSEKPITFYRLKMVDVDGSIEYSKMINSSCENLNTNAIKTFPNPITDVVEIVSTDFIGKVEIFTIDGKLLIEEDGDAANIKINTSSLTPGVYIMKVNNMNYKLIKQ